MKSILVPQRAIQRPIKNTVRRQYERYERRFEVKPVQGVGLFALLLLLLHACHREQRCETCNQQLGAQRLLGRCVARGVVGVGGPCVAASLPQRQRLVELVAGVPCWPEFSRQAERAPNRRGTIVLPPYLTSTLILNFVSSLSGRLQIYLLRKLSSPTTFK